jgi:hypothetical protein
VPAPPGAARRKWPPQRDRSLGRGASPPLPMPPSTRSSP